MNRWYKTVVSVAALGLLFAGGLANADDDDDDNESWESSDFEIEKASWRDSRSLLKIKIEAEKRQTIKIVNAYEPEQVLTRKYLRDDELKLRLRNPQPVPCRIRAINETTGMILERDVLDSNTDRAPSDCSPKDGAEPPGENVVPIAVAGPDQSITLASGQTTTTVNLDGSGSSDPDGSISSYVWSGTPKPLGVSSPSFSLGVGTHLFTLLVTDNNGATSTSDSVKITIAAAPVGNNPPVANAGTDQTISLESGQSIVNVNLNASGSSDADGTVISYNWTGSSNIANDISPTVSLSAGTYEFILIVTDNEGADSLPDSVSVTVNAAPDVNEIPIANAGADQLFTLGMSESTVTVSLDGSGSFDSDGTLVAYTWSGFQDPDDVSLTSITLGVGTHLFSLTVTDNDGAVSAADTVEVIVNPFPTTAEEAHASISVYEGPSTCIACHEAEAEAMHGSVHYQQTGPALNLTNIIPTADNSEGLAGERGNGEIGINTYCGSHENSPRFTCAGCHVGNGRFPKSELPTSEAERLDELSNIDCLMCHQELYKRYPKGEFETLTIVPQGSNGQPNPNGSLIEKINHMGIPVVDEFTKDFQFEPADAESILPTPLMMSRHEAAQTVHKTTRKSCLNCHAKAGGGDGTKRGDISSVLENPPPNIDIHMSSSGANMNCSECHDAGGHRVKGRGLDLRPNDVAERLTCDGCHDRPHGDFSNNRGSSLDKHTSKVACETCHIPTYAKGMPTEVSRDWEDPHFSAAACNGRGGWLPREDKLSDLIPSYNWFDGTSQVYVLGESLDNYLPMTILSDGSEAYTIGKPNGSVDSMGAKIYPMKEHLSKSAVHDNSNQLIPHSTYEFFRTGSFDTAVESALQQTGQQGDSYSIVQVHTFQTISHGVEGSTAALECGECHSDSRLSGGPLRMDLQTNLGYELKESPQALCDNCHKNESSEGFVKTHEKHVEDKRYDCSLCHTFSRPERGLKMSK